MIGIWPYVLAAMIEAPVMLAIACLIVDHERRVRYATRSDTRRARSELAQELEVAERRDRRAHPLLSWEVEAKAPDTDRIDRAVERLERASDRLEKIAAEASPGLPDRSDGPGAVV